MRCAKPVLGAVAAMLVAFGTVMPALAHDPEGGGSPGTLVNVTPSDSLPDTQVVSVSGTGFKANFVDGFLQQCAAIPELSLYYCTESAAFNTNASGAFGPVNFTVTRVFDPPSPEEPPVDCAVRACSVFAATNEKNASHHLNFGGASTATFIYPTQNATNVDYSQPFSWSAASGADGYALYIGTTQGGSNVYSTALLPPSTTSHTPTLVANQTLWARIWTLRGSTWTSSDITFTTAPTLGPLTATFVYPTQGATNVDYSQPFSWTAAASGVQGYALYVGTTQGAGNVFATGLLSPSTTSITPQLVGGQTLWARIWTQRGGNWTFNDVSFTTAAGLAPLTATFVYPTQGATGVNYSQPFSWTPTAAGVQGYALYVGTTPGSGNVFATGLLPPSTTSITPQLVSSQTLWARVWTLRGGTWTFSDVSFTTAAGLLPLTASFTYPTAGATNVDYSQPFAWTPTASGVEGYALYVGTTQGSASVYNSGLLSPSTTSQTPQLAPGQSLWARIWTLRGGNWTFSDVNFTTAASLPPLVATFTYPTQGATNVTMAQPFTWTQTAAGVQGYALYVGTSPGGAEVYSSGLLSPSTTSHTPQLVPNQTLWARIWTQREGSWKSVDISFTTASSV